MEWPLRYPTPLRWKYLLLPALALPLVLFFADRYSKACDIYGELMKKYVNTRHLDTCVRRQFSIADYWVKCDQADPNGRVHLDTEDAESDHAASHCGHGVPSSAISTSSVPNRKLLASISAEPP